MSEEELNDSAFTALGLGRPIVQAVLEKGYTTPSPIQQQCIPAVLAGHDVMAAAQTGTGKTAGFTLGRTPASALGVEPAGLLQGALQVGIGQVAGLGPAALQPGPECRQIAAIEEAVLGG